MSNKKVVILDEKSISENFHGFLSTKLMLETKIQAFLRLSE